jgi:hypothetical protein
MSEHTPEPWTCAGRDIFAMLGDTTTLATVHDTINGPGGFDAVAKANARRIVACVNVCRGVATQILEDAATCLTGLPVQALRTPNAELLAACEAALADLYSVDCLVPGDASQHTVARQLRAAVTRARGETPPAGGGE